jgi:hypothetical protein
VAQRHVPAVLNPCQHHCENLKSCNAPELSEIQISILVFQLSQNATVSVQNATVSVQNATVSVQNATVSVQNATVTVQNATVSVQNCLQKLEMLLIIVLLLRFEDFMAVNMNTALAWDVTLFSLIDRSPSSV